MLAHREERESAAAGRALRRSASLRLPVPSAPLCFLPGLLSAGLSGLETAACKKTEELDNEILAEGDNELITACREKDVPCCEPVTAL